MLNMKRIFLLFIGLISNIFITYKFVNHRSPEIWNNRPYDSSSDIWSLGCMIYELCTLRPPFLGDSFPSLKRAVVAGRYSPLPRKYSEALGRVIGQMLRVNAKERPSADALLRSADFAAKLQLDEITHFVHRNNEVDLMETIKVPGNLRQLNCALPKPCYPDVRPNSPSAWIMADQRGRQRPPPIPAECRADETASVATKDDCSVGTHASNVSKASEHYSRRPLQAAAHENIPRGENAGDAMKPKYNVPLEPIPSGYPYAKVGRPTPLVPVAPNVNKPAGNPGRVQPHRMW